VDKGFANREDCGNFLTLLSAPPPEHKPASDERPSKRARTEPAAPKSEQPALRLMTWNIAGTDLPCTKPASWNVRDKLCAMKREISRLKPDVLALQECPGGDRCSAVPEELQLVGSVEAHPAGCYVQLYARSSYAMENVSLRSGLPAVAGICKVKETRVCFVSAHLFPHPENVEVRSKELKGILSKCGCGEAVVLMGDLNVQRAEVQELCDEHALRAMRYANCSWDPRKNRFYPNLSNFKGDGKVYDQIWSSGPLWVEGHLVGACKEYRAGQRFFLSDHFALLGLLDVHAMYGGVGGGVSTVADTRREFLGALRTSSATQERLNTQARETEGERSLALEADRELQKERGQKMQAGAKARRETEEQRRKLLEEVFGDCSLLAVKVGVSFPAEACSFELEAFRGLPAGRAAEIWRQHVPGGHHSLTELRVPVLSSYVPSAVQLLLRLPAVSMWLAKHVEHCDINTHEVECAKNCVACALWSSRNNFNERSGPGARKSFVPLFVHRHLAGKCFASGGEHDICSFVNEMLAEMCRVETAASRECTWPGVLCDAFPGSVTSASCTHVDRVFAYLDECRRRCNACGHVDVTFTRSRMLSLPVPKSSEEDVVTCVTDLYTESCKMQQCATDWFCRECRKKQEHSMQSRVVSMPNVFLVQVPRFDEQGKQRKFKLDVEEELSLPALGTLQLFGVVYYDGREFGMKDGQYFCLCRGPDWQFWTFDGRGRPSRPREHISHSKRDCSCLLVYTRPEGECMFGGALSLSGKGDRGNACNQEAEAVRSAVQGVAKEVSATGSAVKATSKGSKKGDETSQQMDPLEFAKAVASAEWKSCLACHRKWHNQDEIQAYPSESNRKSMTIVHFRCDDCVASAEWKSCSACHKKWHNQDEIEAYPPELLQKGVTIVRFTCANCILLRHESDEKKRLLAEEIENGQEVEMEPPAPSKSGEDKNARVVDDANIQKEENREGAQKNAAGAKGKDRFAEVERGARSPSDDVGDLERKRQLASAGAEKRINQASRRGIGGSAEGSEADVLKRRRKDSVAVALALRKAAAEEEMAKVRRKEELRKEQAQLERHREEEEQKRGARGLGDIRLSYAHRLKTCNVSVSAGLQAFLRSLFSNPDCDVMRTKDAGGGGDCLFHATGAALENMLRYDTAHPNHALQRLSLEDFRKGCGHIVQKLRGLVADQMLDMTNEDFLNFVLTCALQKNLGAEWYDRWNPLRELRKHGFDVLRGSDVQDVLVAQPDEEDLNDMMLKYRLSDNSERLQRIENGMLRLYQLRESIQAIWSLCGNVHWGTVVDVDKLADALDIGFIIFPNNRQLDVRTGRERWIYGYHIKKSEYPYWITLYCRDNSHFVLAETYDPSQQKYTCFFPNDRLPAPLRAHWSQCNHTPQFRGGIS
jgi:hypothetical protein